MNSIEAVSVSKVLDVNATEAVEVEMVTTSGYGRCSLPAPGEAIKRAREKATDLIGTDVCQQAEIDELLQEAFPLPNMSMAFSVAAANAAAASLGMSLYRYLGGLFANSMPYPLLKVASEDADYFVIPIGASSFARALACSISVFRELNASMSPHSNIVDTLNQLFVITRRASNLFGFDVKIGVDFKASRQSDNGLHFRGQGSMAANERLEHILSLASDYNLYFIEDAFDEAEREFQYRLSDELGTTCLIAAASRLSRDVIDSQETNNGKRANLALITLTRTISSVFDNYAYTRAHNQACAVLTDNSTTCEASPAHLAVALSASFIKLNVRGRQSAAKTNELLRIEQELFDGKSYRMANKPI
jgi:enolase